VRPKKPIRRLAPNLPAALGRPRRMRRHGRTPPRSSQADVRTQDRGVFAVPQGARVGDGRAGGAGLWRGDQGVVGVQ
jgi:hypothetical protein